MIEFESLRAPEFSTISFAHPWFFLLLSIIPLLLLWYLLSGKNSKPVVKFSGLKGIRNPQRSIRVRLVHIPFVLRILAIIFLIIALARPQTRLSWQGEDIQSEGIDVVMSMDLSPSMLARDLKPNRLEAAKKVATEFVDGRPGDRIGMVVFSGEAFTQCPLTIDHSVLKSLIFEVEPDFLPEGTAIGLGLATAVNRLRESKAVSKVVILITDGENNSGSVSPLTAAEIAQLYGIRVYTIGVGSRGVAYSPVYRYPDGRFAFDYTEVRIDEDLLKRISTMTGGQYFRATNNEALAGIYKKIDELEKTIFESESTEFKKKNEEFWFFALIALLLFGLEWLLRIILMRSIP
jgi:Ca-activated chloride channel family protein